MADKQDSRTRVRIGLSRAATRNGNGSREPLTMVVAMYVLESCDLYRSSLSPPPLIFNAMQRGDETAITPNDVRMATAAELHTLIPIHSIYALHAHESQRRRVLRTEPVPGHIASLQLHHAMRLCVLCVVTLMRK